MDKSPTEASTVDGGWGKWENHVIIELKRLSDNQDILRDKLADIDKDTSADIRELKIRFGLYGSGGGAAVVIVFEAIQWFLTNVKS